MRFGRLVLNYAVYVTINLSSKCFPCYFQLDRELVEAVHNFIISTEVTGESTPRSV
jgi:hypothetical protein